MITKSDIAKALNKQKIGNLDHKTSKEAVDFVFDYIEQELYACKKIYILGLFTIFLDITKPRKFFNAHTGKSDMLPYRWKFTCKTARTFNDKIKAKPCYVPDDAK